MRNQVAVIPPPIGGKNTRDPLHLMPATDAVQLKNLFPGDDTADLRGGYTEQASLTGVGSSTNIETLFQLKSGSAEHALAASNGGLYSWHSTPAEVVAASTYTSDRWNWATFADSASPTTTRLLAVNGEDTPWTYTTSGHSSWVFVDQSGNALTEENYIGVQTFKNRVYMWEKDSRDFWFGPLGKIPGNTAATGLTRFPLSGIRGAQGNLIAIEAWTRDAGDGPDDFIVFVTDEGNVIVYQGSNPGDAAAWSLVGVYSIPAPIDTRCVKKVIGDIWILTKEDLYPLSQVIQTQGIAGSQSKLVQDVKDAYNAYASLSGWEIMVWPDDSKAFINIPTSATESRQWAINTRTIAYCDYEGWQARCFGLFDGRAYFGSTDGKIYLCEQGAIDGTSSIEFLYQSPYSAFGQGKRKQIQGVRPFLETSTPISYGLSVSENFQYESPECPNTIGIVAGWTWDNNETFEVFSYSSATNNIRIANHNQSNGTKVRFYGDDLAEPLVADQVYYVINSTPATLFQVSLTEGGAAINLTDSGSGTNSARFGEPGLEWSELKWTSLNERSQQADYDILSGNAEMLSISMCGSLNNVSMKVRALNVSWEQGTEW